MKSLEFDQFLMTARLDHVSPLEHVDPVGVKDRGEAMRNQDRQQVFANRNIPDRRLRTPHRFAHTDAA